MTTTATLADRQARRLRLLGLIRRASEELVELERADHRATQITANRTPTRPTIVAQPGTVPAANIRPELIRAWARTAYPGTVPTRGTIPHAIRRAYANAHPETTPCHPRCTIGPGRDHPGSLEYRCMDEHGHGLPFPGETR